MQYILISAGCAECAGPGDGPLIEIMGPYDSIEDAKNVSWCKDKEFKPHPQGGLVYTNGQGEDWIVEVPDGFTITPPVREQQPNPFA